MMHLQAPRDAICRTLTHTGEWDRRWQGVTRTSPQDRQEWQPPGGATGPGSASLILTQTRQCYEVTLLRGAVVTGWGRLLPSPTVRAPLALREKRQAAPSAARFPGQMKTSQACPKDSQSLWRLRWGHAGQPGLRTPHGLSRRSLLNEAPTREATTGVLSRVLSKVPLP